MSSVLSLGRHACRTATLFLPHSPGNMTDIASQVSPVKPDVARQLCMHQPVLRQPTVENRFSRWPVCAIAGPQRLSAGQCGGHCQWEPRPNGTDDALSASACGRSEPLTLSSRWSGAFVHSLPWWEGSVSQEFTLPRQVVICHGVIVLTRRIHVVAVQCTEEACRLCGIWCRQTGWTCSGQSIACWVINGAELRNSAPLSGCIWMGFAPTCPLGPEGY